MLLDILALCIPDEARRGGGNSVRLCLQEITYLDVLHLSSRHATVVHQGRGSHWGGTARSTGSAGGTREGRTAFSGVGVGRVGAGSGLGVLKPLGRLLVLCSTEFLTQQGGQDALVRRGLGSSLPLRRSRHMFLSGTGNPGMWVVIPHWFRDSRSEVPWIIKWPDGNRLRADGKPSRGGLLNLHLSWRITALLHGLVKCITVEAIQRKLRRGTCTPISCGCVYSRSEFVIVKRDKSTHLV